MADMMAKALEEQAAMQAEMDRQMASLDVRSPAHPFFTSSPAL
jgi:ribosomal protein L31